MTIAYDEDDGETRPRISNRQILGCRPALAARAGALFLHLRADRGRGGVRPDHPVGLARPDRRGEQPQASHRAAWTTAWATLSAIYAVQYASRSSTFRLLERLLQADDGADGERGLRARAVVLDRLARLELRRRVTVRRVSRAMWGYDSASDAILLMLAPTLIVMVGLVVSFGLRWPLEGLFVAVVVALFAVYNGHAGGQAHPPGQPRLQCARISRIGGALSDAIERQPDRQELRRRGAQEARFDITVQAWRKAANKTWDRFNLVGMGQNLFVFTLQAGLTGLMVLAWSQHRAGPEDVVFAITSFIVMAGYMRNFSDITRMLQKGLDDTQDVAAYMLTPPQLADVAEPVPLQPDLGEIRAAAGRRSATRGQPRRLYDDFSLLIRPGERVALVGQTGSGKSTFVKLLQRLYDVQGGKIVIDGQDIAKVRQGDLRRAIAVVPQDPALFHRSIAENIGYARPDATLEEIMLAARRARAHDFISVLPKGYDTLVGERGVKLSGGERQRVAIARAFLADSPILVFDEATSSLDVETEVHVQAATEELMAGRTTIVIAHRLSTIRSADRILVFEGGRIVEEGRHGELVAKGGAYARLHAVTQGV